MRHDKFLTMAALLLMGILLAGCTGTVGYVEPEKTEMEAVMETIAPEAQAQTEIETEVLSATATPATASVDASGNIGEAKAKEIALKHAGLKESDVKFVRVHLDMDDGREEYEVEFYSGTVEYDYDIDAKTGEIRSYDQDAEYYTTETGGSSNSTTGQSSSNIGEAKAKEIALKHAGYTASEVTRLSVEFDYDDGRAEYDVEFYVGTMEYSYEIDGTSGKVLSYEAEKDD